jgi:hypothetical protein
MAPAAVALTWQGAWRHGSWRQAPSKSAFFFLSSFLAKHKEEEERRRVAACREEREKKLERVRRAKAAMEENPDAQKKGKWPCCTQ